MRFSSPLLIILALFLCVNAYAADTGSPTGSTLDGFVLYKNNPTVNTTLAAGLRASLVAHVTQFITQTRWAPYHEYRNIDFDTSRISMTEPADALYALSLAYPYLTGTDTTGLKGSVRTYLRSTVWAENPHTTVDYTSTQMNAATKRNWNRVPTADFATAVTSGNKITGRLVNIYAVYLFAQNTDSWDLVTASLVPTGDTNLTAVFNDISTTIGTDDANYSRNISSIIGYMRIVDHFYGSSDSRYTAARTKLETMVSNKLTAQRAEGATCLSTMDSNPGDQYNPNGCLYTGSTHDALIQQYYGTTPEIGRILRGYAETASSNIAQWIKRNAQQFFLINYDTPVQEGEVPKALYHTYMGFFHCLSDIQAVDFYDHFQMADMPACKADVYYVERLVRAIEASGSQNWVLHSTATSWPTEIDTTPPVITNPLPVGSQLCTSNPRNITISISTDENATCKYNITDVAYDSMANFFAPTGTTSHSSVISLACSASYVYYCRCSDATGNKNSTSSLISFLIAAPSGGTVGGLIMGGVTR